MNTRSVICVSLHKPFIIYNFLTTWIIQHIESPPIAQSSIACASERNTPCKTGEYNMEETRPARRAWWIQHGRNKPCKTGMVNTTLTETSPARRAWWIQHWQKQALQDGRWIQHGRNKPCKTGEYNIDRNTPCKTGEYNIDRHAGSSLWTESVC